MSTREILTLQFGHYSNYVGAHFWNIQELSFDYTGTEKTECNHDILYREGCTSTGEVTYTPRLLLADLKGALKTLPASGGLPDLVDDEPILWDKVEKVEEEKAPKNQYLEDIESDAPSTAKEKNYDLESVVQTWTDFLYPRFHPRTVNIINEYQHENDLAALDTYPSGRNLWKSDFGESFSDNIRKYVEECDSIQGFHITFDSTNGFSGLALSCIEHLNDEYKKSILAHPIIPSYFSDNDPTSQEERDKSNINDSKRLANLAISIEELSENATFFVPLCMGENGWRKPGNPRSFDFVNYNPQLYYHSSALLASALDTLSLKYRHKSNNYSLSDLSADMTGYGRKMAAASLSLPFAIKETNYLIDHLNNVTKPLYTAITPNCKIGTDKIFQLITVRGIPENIVKAPLKEAKEQKNLPAYRCDSVKEMFDLYFQATNFLSATDVTIVEKPLKVCTPFPRFFSKKLNKYGYSSEDDQEELLESMPVLAGYHNGNFVSDTIERLHRESKRVKFSKLHMFKDEGLESAEFSECLDRLAQFKDNYEDDFEL